MAPAALHVRGRGLPDGQPVQWWILDGLLQTEPVPDADTVFGADGADGWVVPGLVDAHCHVGLGPVPGGAVGIEEAAAKANRFRREVRRLPLVSA